MFLIYFIQFSSNLSNEENKQKSHSKDTFGTRYSRRTKNIEI